METYVTPVGRTGGGDIHEHVVDGSVYYKGTVGTPHGYVRVYSQTGPGYTTLSFIFQKQEFYAIEQRNYRPRFLVTLAKRFAEEARRTVLFAADQERP